MVQTMTILETLRTRIVRVWIDLEDVDGGWWDGADDRAPGVHRVPHRPHDDGRRPGIQA